MICPCCGYTDEVKYNPSKKIRELRGKRTRHTKKLLRQAINLIQTNIPSENNINSEYYLYQSISKIKDKVIDWSVSQFISNKYYLKGKGFKYLSSIIVNHNKNRDTVSKHELLQHGKPPSVVKIKEG
tara:strand:+ start:5638 stop:6018 length:381 start_codon:yes stop_codon:yes gene_type:complete